MPAPALRLLRLGLPAAACVAAVFAAASTLWALAESRFAGPVSDFWLFIPKLAAYDAGGGLWSLLWEPYGGHRLVLPKLLYLIEYEHFGGRNDFLVACNVALQTLTAALLVHFSWRRGDGLSGPERVWLAAVSVLLCFSSTQLENFSRGWNVHHFLACWASVAALAALANAGEARGARRAWAWLAAALGAALAGTFSMAIALPIWPILLLLAWRARLSRAQVALLACVASLVLLAFFAGHEEASAGALAARLTDLPGLLRWAAACLSGPLGWRHAGLGLGLVALALVGVAAAGAQLLRSGRRPRPLEILHFGLVGLGVGAALLASYGRVAGHAENWDAHRYQSFVLLFWLGVIGVGTLASSGAGWRRGLRWALGALAVAWISGALLPAQLREQREVREFASRVRTAHDALLVGVSERRAYRDSLPKILWEARKPDMAAVGRPWLARRQLGMFADGRQRRLGLDIARDFESAPEDACRGSLLNVRFVGGFPVLEGAVEGGREILVADGAGRVVGLGRVTRTPLFAASGRQEGFAAWMPKTPPGAPISVWTLLPDGRACRILAPQPLEGGYRGRGRGGRAQMRRSAPSQ